MKRNLVMRSRMMLVLAGLSLGYLARAVIGVPAVETENEIRIEPIPVEVESEIKPEALG